MTSVSVNVTAGYNSGSDNVIATSTQNTSEKPKGIGLSLITSDVLEISSSEPTAEEVAEQQRVIRLKVEASLRSHIAEVVSSSESSVDNDGNFKELWNEKIIEGLGFEANELEKIEDTEILDISEHLDIIQVRSLIQPNSIGNEDINIWASIPDKLESPDINGNDLEWHDDRSDVPYEQKFFQRISDYGYKMIEKRSLVNAIDSLENSGWQMSVDDIVVPVTAEQKAKLEEAREALKEQINEYEKSQEQFEALAVTLRMTKTTNNILGTIGDKDGSEHINENLIDGYIQALRDAPTMFHKMAILNNLKTQVSDLLNDFYEFQTDTLANFENVKSNFDESNHEVIQNYISRVLDKLITEFGQSFGDYIVEGHSPPDIENPLGIVPNSDLNNISNNPSLQEGYRELNQLFAETYNGSSKLNFETLKPIVAKIQGQLNQDQIPDSINSLDFDSSLQKYDPSKDLLSEIYDDKFNIVKYTKEAFDGFLSNEERRDSVGIQLGFTPFASTEQNQNKIELILSSPKYSDLFDLPPAEEVDTQQGTVTIQWTPALLSRIMFLYNRYADSMAGETQSQLNEVEML